MQVAGLTKLITLAVVSVLFSGCAHYDYSFNRAQEYVDTVRYYNSKLTQGQLP